MTGVCHGNNLFLPSVGLSRNFLILGQDELIAFIYDKNRGYMSGFRVSDTIFRAAGAFSGQGDPPTAKDSTSHTLANDHLAQSRWILENHTDDRAMRGHIKRGGCA